MKIQIDKQVIENVLDCWECDATLSDAVVIALKRALTAESVEQEPVAGIPPMYPKPNGSYDVKITYHHAPAVPVVEQEPFGYFKAEPFGWTDCAETDEGAIPLYLHPAPAVPEVEKYREALEMAMDALKDWSDYGGTYMPEHTHTDSIWQDTDSAIEKIEEVLE